MKLYWIKKIGFKFFFPALFLSSIIALIIWMQLVKDGGVLECKTDSCLAWPMLFIFIVAIPGNLLLQVDLLHPSGLAFILSVVIFLVICFIDGLILDLIIKFFSRKIKKFMDNKKLK